MERPAREQADLRSHIHALWRRKWLFLAIVISIPAVVYVISSLVTKTYEASATVKIQPASLSIPGFSAPVTDPSTQALFIITHKTSQIALKKLDEPPSDAQSLNVTAEPVVSESTSTTSSFYSLTAQSDSSTGASDLANAYARAVNEVMTGKQRKSLERTQKQLQDQLANTDDPTARATIQPQIQQVQGAIASTSDAIETIEKATPPDTPITPHPKRNTALAGLLAVLLGLGVVAIMERFDRRIRDPEELEPILGASLLSVIPTAAFPGGHPDPGAVREAFRTLAASLVYFNVERPLSTVLVVSPTRGDGKTTVATYLAIALARDGQNVALVDCDLRHPQVAVRLGVEPRAGLSEVLAGRVPLSDALAEVDVGDGRLRVLAAGAPPPNPTRLLSSARMDSVLLELSGMVDIVIIDTPPLLHVSDAIPLVERVSGVVASAKVGSTHREALGRLRQVIETAGGELLGVVATGGSAAGLYGYGRYDYAYRTDDAAVTQTVDETMPAPEGAPSGASQTGPASHRPGRAQDDHAAAGDSAENGSSAGADDRRVRSSQERSKSTESE
jgi:capsular exopolysaccharide synthesis family protein